MRWVPVMLLMAGLAGCAGDPVLPPAPFEAYLFSYPGSAAYVDEHAWLLRIHNPTSHARSFIVEPVGVSHVLEGPVFEDGWAAIGRNEVTHAQDRMAPALSAGYGNVDLGPGASIAYLVQVKQYLDPAEWPDWNGSVGLSIYETSLRGEGPKWGGSGDYDVLSEALWIPVEHEKVDGQRVQAGMHVLTATVGVWANGTSFYTNIQALNDDAAFPAGYDRTQFSGQPLPVYVYDQDRSEQPPRSIDTCHFTTIPGYNALLKTQHERSTGARFLEPAEAYTRPGSEGHALYGDALVFVNTLIAIEGTTQDTDDVPDPQGACFDVDRYTPEPIPDLTRR